MTSGTPGAGEGTGEERTGTTPDDGAVDAGAADAPADAAAAVDAPAEASEDTTEDAAVDAPADDAPEDQGGSRGAPESVKPAKSSAAPGGASAGAKAESVAAKKPLPPAAKRKVAKKAAEPSGRYTPPTPSSRKKGPSPRWVPVLMFALWGVGLLMILLNYVGLLPGSDDGGNGWYLVGGLAAILAGIITATQYR